MTDERAIEILDPKHMEHYDSIETVNEACRIGMRAIKAFELLLEDVYNTRLQVDTMSCSSCPFMEEIFDECQNQGLYEDCKKRWREYYLRKAEDGE